MTETVLVAGAGIGGVTAAIGLREKGFDVRVFEARPSAAAQTGGTGLNVWSNATAALERLGLRDEVARRGVPIERNEIRSARGGELLVSDTRSLVEQIGAPSVSVRRAALMEALLHRLDLEVEYGRRAVGYRDDDGQVRVDFDDGTSEAGDLLIASDGVRSKLRDQMYGEDGPTYLGQSVWRGIAPSPPQLTAKTLHLMWGDNGIVGGCYPVDDTHACWFVGTRAPRGETRVPEDVQRTIVKLLEGVEGPLIPAVMGTPQTEIIRTDLFARPMPNDWYRGRAVLLGDAAHAMPTALGQGGCQAIEDAVTLASCLQRDAVEAGLEDYQRRRSARVSWVRGKVERIWSFQEYTHPFMCAIRNSVVRLVPERGSQKMWRRLLTFSA